MMIPLHIAQEMLDLVCRLCRRLAPQHADCTWCQATDACRRAIKGPTDKDATKPPPDWSTTAKIPIEDVLKWELHHQIVSSAIVDAAGLAANIPEKYQQCWMGTRIDITDVTDDYFTVHLAAWDADIVP